jgi:hypothetical protein
MECKKRGPFSNVRVEGAGWNVRRGDHSAMQGWGSRMECKKRGPFSNVRVGGAGSKARK